MKILHVNRSLANGGAEKFSVELSSEQSKKNDVLLCSIKKVEDWMYPPKKLSRDVKLIVFNIQKKYSFEILIKMFKLLRQEKPDIVHVHSGFLMFYLLFLALGFRSTRFVQTVHNTLTPAYKKLFDFINKLPCGKKRFTHVCISKNLYDVFSKNYPKLNFKWVDNGIYPLLLTANADKVRMEIIKLKSNEKPAIFVAVGNYSRQKNFALLARVFMRMEKEGQNVILVIIGKDVSPNQQRYLDVEQIKGKRTFLLGAKPNIGDYLNIADALVSSSLMEGMPLVILEAFSMGLPVVATPAGGVVDLIENGVNGIIAPGYQEEDLLLALKTFLSLSKQQKLRIKENNIKKFTENYTMVSCAKKYCEHVYQEK